MLVADYWIDCSTLWPAALCHHATRAMVTLTLSSLLQPALLVPRIYTVLCNLRLLSGVWYLLPALALFAHKACTDSPCVCRHTLPCIQCIDLLHWQAQHQRFQCRFAGKHRWQRCNVYTLCIIQLSIVFSHPVFCCDGDVWWLYVAMVKLLLFEKVQQHPVVCFHGGVVSAGCLFPVVRCMLLVTSVLSLSCWSDLTGQHCSCHCYVSGVLGHPCMKPARGVCMLLIIGVCFVHFSMTAVLHTHFVLQYDMEAPPDQAE